MLSQMESQIAEVMDIEVNNNIINIDDGQSDDTSNSSHDDDYDYVYAGDDSDVVEVFDAAEVNEAIDMNEVVSSASSSSVIESACVSTPSILNSTGFGFVRAGKNIEDWRNNQPEEYFNGEGDRRCGGVCIYTAIIGDRDLAIAAIREIPIYIPRLERLDFISCKFDDSYALILAEIIRDLPSLAYFDLSGCEISYYGIKDILELGVVGHPSLKKFNYVNIRNEVWKETLRANVDQSLIVFADVIFRSVLMDLSLYLAGMTPAYITKIQELLSTPLEKREIPIDSNSKSANKFA
jgi:hypothetical protein